jgi:hypothetical protein
MCGFERHQGNTGGPEQTSPTSGPPRPICRGDRRMNEAPGIRVRMLTPRCQPSGCACRRFPCSRGYKYIAWVFSAARPSSPNCCRRDSRARSGVCRVEQGRNFGGLPGREHCSLTAPVDLLGGSCALSQDVQAYFLQPTGITASSPTSGLAGPSREEKRKPRKDLQTECRSV